MDAEIARLCEIFRRIHTLLDTVGEERWKTWVERDLRLIERLDAHGLDHFLSAFGGTGSINDLVIHPMNGHRVSDESIDAVNEELRRLLSDANSLARKLRADDREAGNV